WQHFDFCTIHGDVAGTPISAVVENEEPSGHRGAFTAHGHFASDDFSLRGTVTAGTAGLIEGALSGRPVQIGALISDDVPRTATLSGTYDGPAPLLLALIVALLH